MNYPTHKAIENLINEVAEKGIVSKAQLYQDLKALTANFSEIALELIKEDVNDLIKNLEYKYKPLDWKKPFTVLAPTEYNNQMQLIKKELSNLQELNQFITKTIQANEPKGDLSVIVKEQNKLIPKVSISDVINHFEILTQSTNKNDEFYLTNSQLVTFIKSTFIDLKPIKQDFNCNSFQKNKVRKVFYNFYDVKAKYETNQKSLKLKYFNIMNDAFNGFNKNDYTDFAK